MITRGIKNNNPFNIKLSLNSWKGKIYPPKNTDGTFEQFKSMSEGLRAGFLLLRNGYLNKGFDTPEKIIKKYAPASENNVTRYLNFICTDSPLALDTKITLDSLTFFWLCQRILLYESQFKLDYQTYRNVVDGFHLW